MPSGIPLAAIEVTADELLEFYRIGFQLLCEILVIECAQLLDDIVNHRGREHIARFIDGALAFKTIS